ncbi:hypothetical protein ACOMHN_044494 [Nucella lapillus]
MQEKMAPEGKPDVVIIHCGANDLETKEPEEDFKPFSTRGNYTRVTSSTPAKTQLCHCHGKSCWRQLTTSRTSNGSADVAMLRWEMIGVLTYDSFVAFPDYKDRVNHSTNASIIIYNVEPVDSGNYTVQVTGSNITHHYYELRQTVYIQIADHLMTQDGRVHVSQELNPVLDEASGLWTIQLTCGDFVFKGQQPPYDVQWTFPEGEVMNSSKYKNGRFYLTLNGAMQSGNYTCRVPLNETCLSVDTATYGADSIYLDSVDIRLALLEKENEQLKLRLQESTRVMNDRKIRLEKEIEQLKVRLQNRTQENTRDNVRLEKEIEQLRVRLEGVTGPIRLKWGWIESEGLVEFRVGTTWGSVCGDHWGSNEAKVVCNMLGYFA